MAGDFRHRVAGAAFEGEQGGEKGGDESGGEEELVGGEAGEGAWGGEGRAGRATSSFGVR